MNFQKTIIDVKVSDLERAIIFYRDILGLKLIHKDKDWASFESKGLEIHLYLHGGVSYGLEFRVIDIEQVIKTLETKGVSFYVESDQPNLIKVSGKIMEFPWGKASLFKDSEGNQLALVEDK